MRIPARLVVPLFVLALASCSDDDGPTGGNGDTTPPAVAGTVVVDFNHVEVAFDESLQRASAEDPAHYVILESVVARATASAEGDTLRVSVAALKSDQRTVSLSVDSMSVAPYDLSIYGVMDASGNAIATPLVASFDGTSDPDETAPEIAYRSPAPNASNVPASATVDITFTEEVSFPSVLNGVTWTSPLGEVIFTGHTTDWLHFSLVPTAPLALATRYTLTLAGVVDHAGHEILPSAWSFTTTGTADETQPAVASSSPAHLATNVDVDTDFTITFNEPMDPSVAPDFEAWPEFNVPPGEWTSATTWSFDPTGSLTPGQQYALILPDNSARDVAGNWARPTTIVFSTGATIASGRITGKIDGDPQSNAADNPGGALVRALQPFVFSATTIADAYGNYELRNLPDGDYLLFADLEANGNADDLEPGLGDATGRYGVDVRAGNELADAVSIVGGNHVMGADFPLYDPSAVVGIVWYGGSQPGTHEVIAGLWNVSGFDPNSPPDYQTRAEWPNYPEFAFNTLAFDIPDVGDYYVGAILDLNDNTQYDPGIDAYGFYGNPTSIRLEDGKDIFDIFIVIHDPVAARASHRSAR